MVERSFDLSGTRVMLVMPILYDVGVPTFLSMLDTQAHCVRGGIDLRITPIIGVRYVPAARSQAAHEFLKSDATHLFFIDVDMVWRPADFLRFIALGTKMECLCAAYPYRRDPIQFMLQMTPEFEAGGSLSANEWGCIPFKGTGLGFTIVQRSVIERLAERSPRLKLFPNKDEEPVPVIFETDSVGDRFRGEDMNFFAKVEALGLTVWLDPSIELGHVGEKEYRGRFADHLNFGNAG